MIRVRNRSIIRSLAKKQFKANRNRNLLLIIAISLVTFMLTTVFSLGINYYQALTERNIRLNGSLHDGAVWGPTDKQVKQFKTLSNIKYAGLMVGTATITKFNDLKVETTLVWSDPTNWEKQLTPAMEYIQGTYPNKINDIMLSEKALKKMGIDSPKIGMTLPLTYASDTGFQNGTFVLSGYFNDYSNKDRGFISKAFHNKIGVSITDIEKSRLYLTFVNPLITDADLDAMAAAVQLTPPQLITADTEQFATLKRMLFVVLSLVLLIMTSAYLLIYTILYLSINQDIRYYGLLKTIGTTTKQIKTLVFIQLLQLSIIAIPLGLISGAIVSVTLVPTLLTAVSVYTLSPLPAIHPLIFGGGALFSIITVYLSTQKPARLAGNISPIEALNYTGLPVTKKTQRSKDGAKIITMAWRNMFRYKKRAFAVFLSLFLGLTAFLTITSLLDSNRADRVLDKLVSSDISLGNKSSGDPVASQTFTPTFLAKLQKLEGIKEIHPITATDSIIPLQQSIFDDYIKKMYAVHMNETYEDGLIRMTHKPEEFMGVLVGIDELTFERLVADNQLSLNKEAFLAGKSCILKTTWQTEDTLKKSVEKSFNFTINNQLHGIKIVAVTSSRDTPSVRYTGFYPDILVSDNLIAGLVEVPLINTVNINYGHSYDRELERDILAIVNKDKMIDVESKIDRYDNMKDSDNQLAIFGYTLAFILAFLGIMNYLNLMASSIITRSQEFATLQSIGMSRKQLKQLLITEGLGYGLLSLLFVSLLGTASAYAIFQVNNVDNLTFVIPLWPVFITFLAVLMVCAIVPLILFAICQKGSIIDQLKRNE